MAVYNTEYRIRTTVYRNQNVEKGIRNRESVTRNSVQESGIHEMGWEFRIIMAFGNTSLNWRVWNLQYGIRTSKYARFSLLSVLWFCSILCYIIPIIYRSSKFSLKDVWISRELDAGKRNKSRLTVMDLSDTSFLHDMKGNNCIFSFSFLQLAIWTINCLRHFYFIDCLKHWSGVISEPTVICFISYYCFAIEVLSYGISIGFFCYYDY